MKEAIKVTDGLTFLDAAVSGLIGTHLKSWLFNFQTGRFGRRSNRSTLFL